MTTTAHGGKAKADYQFFDIKKPGIFYRVPAKYEKQLKTAVILFGAPFTDGSIEASQEIFNNSMVSVFVIRSEGRIFGHAISIPTIMKYRSIGASMLSAAKKSDLSVPNEVFQIFFTASFSIYTDDLEQAILCVCNTPSIIDVSRG